MMSKIPDIFLHCTYDGRTAICDGQVLKAHEDVTEEDKTLPCCHTCVILNDHYRRERRSTRRKVKHVQE